MSLTNVSDQLSSLRTKLGEPTDAAQARWTPTQLLVALNEARRTVAEETWCFPVKDSQVLAARTKLISVSNDFIWVSIVKYDGRPLRLIRPGDWSDVIGQDETLPGDPACVKYFGRQFQIFPITSQANKTILYEGRSYPQEVVANGVEPCLTDSVVEVTIWQAAADLLGQDGRDNSYAEGKASVKKTELAKQYKPRGARYVKTADLYLPWRPTL